MKEQFTYILKSKKDGKLYIGATSNLKERLRYHNRGKVRSTKGRRPLTLVYAEKADNRAEALKKEKYLKNIKNSAVLRKYITVNGGGKILANTCQINLCPGSSAG